APRKPDGSLPENDFARLIAGSIFIDKGQAADDFIPVRFMTEAEAAAAGMELTTAPTFTIEYNDAAPDMGAFETGVPTVGRLYVMAGQTEQLVYKGSEIEPVVIQWGGAATDVNIDGVGSLKVTKDVENMSLTISGSITDNTTVTVTTIGGETAGHLTLTFKVSDTAPATLICTSNNLNQTVFIGRAIEPVTIVWGGGATGIEITDLPAGLTYKTVDKVTTITGTPTEDGAYTVNAIGGMKPLSLSGKIARVPAYKVLTGDWYNFQDEFAELHAELKGIVSLEDGGSYVSTWNPAYTESGNTVPGGCTQGAVNVERDGALVWELPSLLELKANIHFTGGRTLQVKWQYEGEDEHVWTSTKMSKT
ncbi:MAG: hypothetical protein K2K92_08425, partial [Duncaniella sp.]|nr:hypothetical protein [Duncaniella sp.]